MEDEDMFTMQKEPEGYGDELYTSIAKEIVVRKCKMLQRREKFKLAIEAKQKLIQELKFAKRKKKYNNEESNINNQKSIWIMNISRTHDSRASLEKVLCDLRNQFSEEKTKTKMKRDKYKADIKDAADTWESYEKIYNELPLAKKIQERVVEMKKLQIKMKIILFDIDDIQYKTKLRNGIRGKMFHNWGVSLAKFYFSIQEEKAEKNALLSRKSELEKRIEDIKTGKTNTDLYDTLQYVTKPVQTSEKKRRITSLPGVLEFHLPDFHINSPPSENRADSSSNWSSLFKWESLLGSSSFVKPLPKQKEHISPGQNIIVDHSENKRKRSFKTKDLTANQIKKVKKSVNIQPVQNKIQNKENVKTQESTYSLSNIKKLMSSFNTNKKIKTNIPIEKIKAVHQYVVNPLQLKNTNVQHNNNELALHTSASSVTEQEKQSANYHPTGSQETQPQDTEDISAASQSQLDTNAMIMDPTSPPDIIPVENNSQPLSQGITTSTISGKSQALSDYTSPLELDEAAKLAYQRIANESPGFIYPRGPEQKKSVTQAPQNAVHSQYFTNVSSPQSQSLNTPEDFQPLPYSPPANHSLGTGPENVFSPPTEQAEYQTLPYSPPANHSLGNGTKSVLSPPTGQLGNFQNSTTMSLFGKPAEENKSSGGGFGGFSFDAPKKKSSFFSLF